MKMRKMMTSVAALFMMATAAFAQDNKQPEKQTATYKVKVALFEVEGGKRTNVREYEGTQVERNRSRLQIGTRVPILTGTTGEGSTVNYIDAGFTLNCMLRDASSDIIRAEYSIELSNIVGGESQSRTPAFRHTKIDSSSLFTLGKPLVVGQLDDVNSVKRFQVEMTVSLLK